MIKFTVKSKARNETYTFYKKEVLIGSSREYTCDLSLPESRFEPTHLLITEEEDRFIVKNLANDPFATLNDLPFGKRIIKDQDVIVVGDTMIIFEGALTKEGQSYQEFPLFSTKGNLAGIVEEAIERAATADEPEEAHPEDHPEREDLPLQRDSSEDYPLDMDALNDLAAKDSSKEMDPAEMEALLEEWQEIENEFRGSHAETSDPPQNMPAERDILQAESTQAAHKTPPQEAEPTKKTLILDLSDNEHEPLPFKTSPPPRAGATQPKSEDKPVKKIISALRPQLKIIFITFAIATLLLFLLIGGSLWKFNHESEKRVIEVSRSVSDIALAMTYAQIHHIIPHQHNWSNPQFLKSSVAASLSPHHEAQLRLEGNGKLNDDYLLRIYTNRDNSRFVIIAQPEPSLFHYLTTPDSIVVDSAMMTLRRINDLKALNRLLIDPDQLHSPGSDDVARILNRAQIIPMDLLADKDNHNGFKTPERLKVKYPGAENYIYNSPRYSRVGDRIMSEAVEALSKPTNSSEMRKLKEVLRSIAKLPFAVMYTTKGKEHAEKAKMAISSIVQGEDFLLAYIDYDEKSNKTTSYLIDDEDLRPTDGLRQESELDPLKAARAAAVALIGEATSQRPLNSYRREMELASPLYTELNNLSNQRRGELEKIHSELDLMISHEIEEPGSYTIEDLQQKAIALTEKIEQTNVSIMRKLYQIYGSHKNIPLSEFLDYVEKSGLRSLAANELFSTQGQETSTNCSLPEEGKKAILEIEAASNFSPLFDAISKAASYFSCDPSEDPQLIIAFQNQVKGAVVDKLNDFILLRSFDDESDVFTPDTREKLSQAMKEAWIFDLEEQNYYLDEFTRRYAELN
ncbi:FHA domain-containing protein [Estrella lausannensis]|uniref:FHA domain-containing protein n=1 Tax=Estrella lausannensis TaxID=483423 RepID=A0A0H5DQI4_9BACT|nr:FHA domain-containing protein [Estrella lausannensis]CRX37824.1 conserved hypothetical protein [Estrella lausannensis]